MINISKISNIHLIVRKCDNYIMSADFLKMLISILTVPVAELHTYVAVPLHTGRDGLVH